MASTVLVAIAVVPLGFAQSSGTGQSAVKEAQTGEIQEQTMQAEQVRERNGKGGGKQAGGAERAKAHGQKQPNKLGKSSPYGNKTGPQKGGK